MITKISIIGGGVWGSTLAQVLAENQHEILIYDNNIEYINKINNRNHPCFNIVLSENIKGTNNLKKVLYYSNFIFLCIPAQNMRNLFQNINKILTLPKNFINVSKGIEYSSNKIIYQIIKEEIPINKIKNYACLYGPSHAEEVILKKITFLTVASFNNDFALKIVKMCSNKNYLKIFTSNDVIGFEICASFKNALSLVSGILDGINFATNARAAFITLGLAEMKSILNLFSSSKETVLSLAGIGDLIVTSFNEHSRNYQAGKKISQNKTIEQITNESCQIIEGIYNLKVFYDLAIKKKINLPIIESSYKVIFEKKPIEFILNSIFNQI